jgi:hypothetical protein
MPKRRDRIYWPYADFRDYRDVGGGREALIPAGQKLATTDRTVAAYLVASVSRSLRHAAAAAPSAPAVAPPRSERSPRST